MPTHTLISYMESPDGLAQELLDTGSASMPGPGSSMTPHSMVGGEKPAAPSDGSLPVDCMFCDQTFQRQDELSPHVLTQHPTTLFGPAVLRVEAEFLTPGERARAGSTSTMSHPATESEDGPSCMVCGQALEDGTDLEAHMRKHRDSFTYSCGLCGRRFREPWFLKNHMRTHSSKAGARGKVPQDAESPTTINDVVVSQASGPVTGSPYRMCMVCGFFFPCKEVLAEHSKVHSRESEAGEEEPSSTPRAPHEAPVSQQAFLQLLGLRSLPSGASSQPGRSAKWIPELDPFNTYQAWQLATRGKIAVGPGLAKEPEATSDVEDFGSDKEELGEIWATSQNNKSIKDSLRRELRSRRSGGETPSPEPEQKSLAKEKPTQCKDCGKTFRTYHQLVLHSRIHKKDRAEAESPTTCVDSKQAGTGSVEGGALDRAEEASEDGSEEGGTADTCQSDKSEDGFDTSKLKILAPSKECSYCGKYFRSNYYLNIHLRMHTGEKPYRCEYCDYAAAQKTSLRYHLDRRHKDMPEAGSTAKPASPPSPSSNAKEKASPESAEGTEGKRSTGTRSDVSCLMKGEAMAEEVTDPQPVGASSAASKELPLQAGMKMEVEGGEQDVKQERSDLPLNLSFKTSLSASATSVPKSTLISNACPLCAYKTLYPEVLLMHKALAHKDKCDATKKSMSRSSVAALKQKRRTGCPPALEGKDVAPLAYPHSRQPRRTKSPPPQPSKTPEKVPPTQPSHLSQAAKHLSAAEPRRASPPDAHLGNLGARQGTSKLPERQSEWTGRRDGTIASVRPTPADRDAPGQRPRQARNGTWPSDTMMSCLSARFGNLPQVDVGEPCTKRAKYSTPVVREPEPSEAAGLRQSESYSRLMPPERNTKTLLQRSPPSKISKAFGPVKSGAPPPGEMDWNVINILRSYSPSDLASLYQPAMASSSHGASASSAAGNRPLHHPHYPNSALQRRHSLSPMSNARCGPTDKNA